MSSYLPDSNSYNVGNVLTSPIQQVEYEHILSKQISRTQDTIAAAQKQEKKQVQVGQRPSLPPSGKSKNPNYLAIVAEAFSKAFDAMSQGTIQQVKSYADLQQLDETMSQSVLLSTKHAIDKEQKQIKLASEVKAYQEKTAKEDKIFGDIMLVLGIVIILATVVSAIFDAGASLAAVPEEAALVGGEAGAEAGMEAGADAGMEAGDIEMDTFSSSIDEEGGETGEVDEGGETDGAQATDSTETTDTQETNQADQTERQTTNELDQSNEENSKSEDSFKKKALKWLGKKALHFTAAFGFAAPMLMRGIQGLKTAGMLQKTAAAQKEVGAALSTMQQNNAYFQFYQQLLQRASGVVTEETNDASQVTETFGQIANAYQQISYGLANSV